MSKKPPLALKVCLVILVIVSIGLWLTVPKIRFKEQIKKADEAQAHRNFSASVEALKKALQLNPKSRDAIVRLAEVIRIENRQEAFEVLYQAYELGLLEADDFPLAIIMGYEVQEIEKANELYTHADASYAIIPRLTTIRALKSFADGDYLRCRELLDEAIALDPTWSTTYYWKGQVLRNSPSRIDHIQGKQALVKAAEYEDFDGLRACFALVDSTNLAISDEEKVRYLNKALGHAWASDEWQLLALSELVRIDQKNRKQYIETAITDFGQSKPKLLGHWLNRVGEFEKALAYLPDDPEELTKVDVFNERFMALSLSGRLDEAESLLVETDVEQNPLQRASRLFMLSIGQKDMDKTIERWESAYELAIEDENEGAIIFLSKNALRIGYLKGAKRGYDALFAREGFAQRASPEVWSDRFAAELYAGGRSDCLRIAKEASAAFPHSLVLANNQLYLELLMNEQRSESIERFASLLPPLHELSEPQIYGATLALARLKEGNIAEAEKIVTQIRSLRGQVGLSDSTEVVVALVYAAGQQMEEAIKIASSVDRQKVLPEEWLLISSLVAD
jgi:hypothetical protein